MSETGPDQSEQITPEQPVSAQRQESIVEPPNTPAEQPKARSWHPSSGPLETGVWRQGENPIIKAWRSVQSAAAKMVGRSISTPESPTSPTQQPPSTPTK